MASQFEKICFLSLSLTWQLVSCQDVEQCDGGYFCEKGHCCGNNKCCTYYYELWWFWLIWLVLATIGLCCYYHHRRKKIHRHRCRSLQRRSWHCGSMRGRRRNRANTQRLPPPDGGAPPCLVEPTCLAPVFDTGKLCYLPTYEETVQQEPKDPPAYTVMTNTTLPSSSCTHPINSTHHSSRLATSNCQQPSSDACCPSYEESIVEMPVQQDVMLISLASSQHDAPPTNNVMMSGVSRRPQCDATLNTQALDDSATAFLLDNAEDESFHGSLQLLSS